MASLNFHNYMQTWTCGRRHCRTQKMTIGVIGEVGESVVIYVLLDTPCIATVYIGRLALAFTAADTKFSDLL